ncbi:MAG: ABC transporter permease [Elusimicrobia bacterium]|nr:ABC transporter permease [Elusimicrobiota bacterium]
MRNVLRNRRRSGLTLASVVVGVAALFFIQSLIKSLQADMVDRAMGIYNSHIQIQARASQDPKIPEASFGGVDAIEAVLRDDKSVAAFTRRVMFTGLIASAQNSAGVGVVSIDPLKETSISNIHHYIKEGRLLDAPGQIMIGRRIAKNLDVRLGEKVVMMAQNREGSFEGRALRVAGIFETGSYTWDVSIVYMNLEDAQSLLAWPGEINSLAVKIKDSSDIETVRSELSQKIGALEKDLKVLTWKDIGSELVHIQRFQDSILYLVMCVVFVIVALGILNTMLMSLFERIREFGLMMALGAKRKEVAVLLLTESAYLGMMGLAWGAAWGVSVIVFFYFYGLPLPLGEALSYFLPFEKTLHLRFAWPSHLVAVVSVLVISAVAGIVPAVRVFRLRAAEALRHV